MYLYVLVVRGPGGNLSRKFYLLLYWCNIYINLLRHLFTTWSSKCSFNDLNVIVSLWTTGLVWNLYKLLLFSVTSESWSKVLWPWTQNIKTCLFMFCSIQTFLNISWWHFVEVVLTRTLWQCCCVNRSTSSVLKIDINIYHLHNTLSQLILQLF